MKNPLGYGYWKMNVFHDQNRVRFMWVALAFHLYQSFIVYVMVKNKKEKMIESWRWHLGETNAEQPLGSRDRRFPADRKKNYVRYSNFHQALRAKRLGMMHLNWWCRDQNFRKYFEMRKKHDIRPALSGFAHESIFKETTAKNIEIAQMRSTQESR